MNIVKRDGKIVSFDRVKIENAVLKTCSTLGYSVTEVITNIATKVENSLLKSGVNRLKLSRFKI